MCGLDWVLSFFDCRFADLAGAYPGVVSEHKAAFVLWEGLLFREVGSKDPLRSVVDRALVGVKALVHVFVPCYS